MVSSSLSVAKAKDRSSKRRTKKKHSLATAKPILAWPCFFHKGIREAKEVRDVHLEVEYAKGVQ